MIKKTYFEAPQAELLEVRFEENFCVTGGAGDPDPVVDDEEDY